MKNWIISFFILMVSQIAYSQNIGLGQKTFSMSRSYEFIEMPDQADLYQISNLAKVDEDKCRRYRKMKGAGLGMVIGGSAVMVGGIALMVISVADENFNEDEVGGAFVAGVIGMVGGALVGTGGIPLMIVGNIKSKKYCGGSSHLNLKQTKHGVGLAMTF